MSEVKSLTDVLTTEGFKKKGLIYPRPTELITPFIEEIRKVFNVKDEDITVSVDEEGGAGMEEAENVKTWGRGLIYVHINELHDTELGVNGMIGLLWAYDISQSFIKVFRGVNTFACTNLLVSGADDIKTISFVHKSKGSDREKEVAWNRKKEDVLYSTMEAARLYSETLATNFAENIKIINWMRNTTIDTERGVHGFIGDCYINEVLQGRLDYPIYNEGCRLLFSEKYHHDNKHLYHIDLTAEDIQLSMWRFYSALTQKVTDDDKTIHLLTNKTMEITNVLYRLNGTTREQILND